MNDLNESTSPAEAPLATPQVSHDSGVPKALETFLLGGWRPYDPTPPEPLPEVASFQARRKRLSELYPQDVLVIPTGHEKVRVNDTNFRFRPGSDFAYLTGNHEADCVLIMEPVDGGHRDVLYVEHVSRDDISFFNDRNKGELWVGRRLGVAHSQVRYGVDEARALKDLPAYLKELPSKNAPWRALRGLSPAIDGLGESRPEDKALAESLSELRLIKDDQELAALEEVIWATRRGFEDVIRALPRLKNERDVEVLFYGRARTEGNDVGYGSIAACGANACILHWTRNNAPLDRSALFLLDAGVEGHHLYTADITRTFPVSGTFSEPQKAIYQLVWEAQQAAIAAVRPGVDFMAPNRIAMEVLAHGLEKLGILPSAEEALKEEQQLYRRYSLHNISHMLGIDVHDCAAARKETYKFGQLKPGMVFTIEPGLYFQPDDLTVPEQYRGIGVRIEDDIVVTDDGYRSLSSHIPSQWEAVEAWMAQLMGR